MNITFAGIVFNGDYFLEPSICSVRDFGKVVFAEGPTRYFQQFGYTSFDRTNAILAELIGGSNVYHGQFEEKDEEARATERLIPDDTDFVWWLDADECYRREDIEHVIEWLETGQYDSIAFTANSFFGGFDHILTGFEETFQVHRIQRWYPGAHWAAHRPPTVLAPDGRPWREHRHLSHIETDARGVRMFHYSYVYPGQAMAKHGYYEDYQPGICIPDYFRMVFMPWVLGTEEERQRIETHWLGVHNFVPKYRGECFTKPFVGRHPEEIETRLLALATRLNAEIAAVQTWDKAWTAVKQ